MERNKEFCAGKTTTSSEVRGLVPASTSKVVTVKAAASEKRKQQNRAAQKTYREKRNRRLQELEALIPASSPLSSAGASGPSTNAATTQVDAGPLAPQCSLMEGTRIGTGSGTDSDDWIFEFVSPAAVDFSPPTSAETRPAMPRTTTVGYKMPFPGKPTADQCADLARIVLAAYTHAPKSLSTFDPYLNNLHISALSFAAGFFSNALHLGLVESSYCQPTAQSSFHRPQIAESPYSETMVLAVQRSFEGLKPDLRPTRTQIVQLHHPAVDVLPFPGLRRNLIEALSHDPPLVDEHEFWEDLRMDGVLCWGNASAELSGGGVPWDARSWEAKPWFLDKWRCVLGGEDGELWRASRWWREVRGEYL